MSPTAAVVDSGLNLIPSSPTSIEITAADVTAARARIADKDCMLTLVD